MNSLYCQRQTCEFQGKQKGERAKFSCKLTLKDSSFVFGSQGRPTTSLITIIRSESRYKYKYFKTVNAISYLIQ